MSPIFFKDQFEFRNWLAQNHKKETELIVGYYKKDSGKQNMTWSESVDQALCFGWIDGIRKSIDDDSYCIRFTPRKPTSVWSAVNIAKVEELTKQGLMQKAGLDAFSFRKEEKSRIYSYEDEVERLNRELETKFQANPKAWNYYSLQPPSYRKMVIRWIMSAKQESTRLSRLEKAIAESEKQKRLFNGDK